MNIPQEFYFFAFPIFCIMAGIITLILLSGFSRYPKEPSFTSLGVALSTLFAAALMSIFTLLSYRGLEYRFLGASFVVDNLALVSQIFICILGIFTLIFSYWSPVGRLLSKPEIMPLFLTSVLGLILTVMTHEWITFFIGLELSSLSLYVLVGYISSQKLSTEAAMKYFITGSAGSAVLFMGSAFLYCATGSLHWAPLNYSILSTLGLIFLFCGFGFKLSLVPFHFWTPDVYQGAPSILVAFMSSAVKFAFTLAFMRFINASISPGFDYLNIILIVMIILSLVIGSILGLAHQSVKRILAYSSIANSGYIAIIFYHLLLDPSKTQLFTTAVLFLILYSLGTLGSYGILSFIETDSDIFKYEIQGLGVQSPVLGSLLTLFLLSTAGIPPLAGFIGKWQIFSLSLENYSPLLTTILILGSVLSFAYYLQIISRIWFYPTEEKLDLRHISSWSLLSVFICFILMMVIGYTGPIWMPKLF